MDNTIRIWDTRKAGYLMSLDQHDTPDTKIVNKKHRLSLDKSTMSTAHSGAVTGLTFTPEGRFLMSTGMMFFGGAMR